MKCNIENIIVGKGLKKGYIAKELGISSQQLRRWIIGNYYPPADKLFKLAKLLDCKVDDLYELEEG